MIKIIQNYLTNIQRLLQTGNAREHSYRGHLETLLNNIIDVTRTDLKHYNKIINALVGTDVIMKEIDGVLKV